MGKLDSIEGKLEDIMDRIGGAIFKSSLNPVQISKRAEKAMRRGKLVANGRQYAPTLYSVIVSPEDDRNLAGFYPTIAGETETFLGAKATEAGLCLDGDPLVRFIVDETLKPGRFDVYAENVSAPIVAELRAEEMERYGIYQEPHNAPRNRAANARARFDYDQPRQQDMPPQRAPREQRAPQQSYQYSPEDAMFAPRESYAKFGGFGDVDDFDAPAPAPAQAPAQTPVDAENYETRVPRTALFGKNPLSMMPPKPNRDNRTLAYLLAVNGMGTWQVRKTPTTIGREDGNDIVIRDINISRTHAELILDNGTWYIHDLGSTNGTKVNGREVGSEVMLQDGDRITLGTTQVEFQEN